MNGLCVDTWSGSIVEDSGSIAITAAVMAHELGHLKCEHGLLIRAGGAGRSLPESAAGHLWSFAGGWGVPSLACV